MKKRKPQKTVVFRGGLNPADLRDLAWRVQGIGYLIGNVEPDAVPSKKEVYGIGQVLLEIGLRLEELSTQLEGTSDKKGSYEAK